MSAFWTGYLWGALSMVALGIVTTSIIALVFYRLGQKAEGGAK